MADPMVLRPQRFFCSWNRDNELTSGEQELQEYLAGAPSAALASLGNMVRLTSDTCRGPNWERLPALLSLVEGAEQQRALAHGWGSALEDENMNPLLAVPDEVAINIACKLDSPLDLLNLSKACKRFRLKTVSDDSHQSGEHVATRTRSRGPPAPKMWSIVSEAARRWIAGDSRVPMREGACYLGLMHEVAVLSEPLRFARSGPPGNVTRSEGGALVTSCTTGMFQSAGEGSAVSEIVMRAGRRKSESQRPPKLKKYVPNAMGHLTSSASARAYIDRLCAIHVGWLWPRRILPFWSCAPKLGCSDPIWYGQVEHTWRDLLLRHRLWKLLPHLCG